MRRPIHDADDERLRTQIRRRRRHLAFLSVAVPIFVFVGRATIFLLEVVMYSLTAAIILSELTPRQR